MVTAARALAVVVACLLALPAWAASLTLELKAASLRVGQSSSFTLTVQGGVPDGMPDMDGPIGLAMGFVGQAQQTTIVNNRMERFTQFQYQLSAQAEGTYTLGPATVTVQVPGQGRVDLRSNAIVLEVGPPEVGGSTAELTVANGFDVTDAWQGQVVVYHQAVRSRLDIQSGRWLQAPSDGLLAPKDGRPEQNEYDVQDADGNLHVVDSWQPFVVTDSGTLTYEAPLLQVNVYDDDTRRRSVFGFFRPTRTATVVGSAMTLRVRPLPPPPPGFSGLVGDFTIRSRFDANEVKVGGSVGWSIFLDGDGSPEGYTLPPAPDIDGVRVYDTPPRARSTMRKDRYRGGVTFERTLVATRPGTVEVPPVEVVVFSPSKGAYETLVARGATLRVEPGEGADVALQSFGPDGEAVLAPPEPPEQVHGAWTSGPAQRLPWLLWMPLALALAAVPSVALVLGAAAEAVRTRLAQARQGPDRQATPRERLARLPDDHGARLTAMDDALRLALAQATGTDVARLDRTEALAALPDDVAPLVRTAFAALDRVRFAGAAPPAGLDAQVRAAVDALEAR